ncbi:ABC transporter substrate-binding protein [Bauldia sp.]|uniref:ABC transporter substrate-binding protein n=1 Tax=Bauldia sp. TaxID=2575872 RepID=UPI003BAD0F5A
MTVVFEALRSQVVRCGQIRAAALCGALAVFVAGSEAAMAEPGVYADRIVFGQSAAFDGPAASLGLSLRAGIVAAFDEANRSGGVHGRRLELLYYDDGYEPEEAILNTRRLIEEDDVFALIGEVGTPTSRATQPIAEEMAVPFIAPFTGAGFLRDNALSTVVNVRASYDQETEELVRYLTQDLGLLRIAVLFQDDTFGRAGLNGVVEALERRGLEPVADFTYMRNTVAVKRAVLALRRADPEAVIIIGAYNPTAEFIHVATDAGMQPVFATVSFVGANALAAELDPVVATVVVSQVVPLYGDSDDPLSRSFQDAMEAQVANMEARLGWKEAGFVGLEGYVAGRLAVEALRQIGPEPTRSAFLDTLSSETSFDIDGLELTFGRDDNQGSDAVFLTAIASDGSFAYVDTGLSQ